MEKVNEEKRVSVIGLNASLSLLCLLNKDNTYFLNSGIDDIKYNGETQTVNVKTSLNDNYSHDFKLTFATNSISINEVFRNENRLMSNAYAIEHFCYDESGNAVYICIQNGKPYKYFVGKNLNMLESLSSGWTEKPKEKFVMTYK